MRVTVACVLKSGGDYTPEYAHRLCDGVRRNATVPYHFTCFSDVELPGISRHKLSSDLPGWLSKLEVFRLTKMPVVYFDLDTVITGNIDDILLYPHRFTMLSDFYHPQHPASGVMAFCGDYRHILEDFRRSDIEKYVKYAPNRGDAGWIETKVPQIERFDKVLPGRIGSYKAGMPEGASVCCFHGKPRPHEVNWNAR